MTQIKINDNFTIHLQFNQQTDDKGRNFRLSGVSKVRTKPEKWIKELNAYRSHWIYSFRYIGTDEFFGVEIDYNNKFVSKVKI